MLSLLPIPNGYTWRSLHKDMKQRIIYPTEDGGVAIICPTAESKLTIEQIAEMDVPEGVPFKIINADQIPSDRTFRNAWEFTI
jgi:hypothetical protein